MEFPYIRSLQINDCYTYQSLNIHINDVGEPFKHLVLTGRNGSGKTTILSRLSYVLALMRSGQQQDRMIKIHEKQLQKAAVGQRKEAEERLKNVHDVIVQLDFGSIEILKKKDEHILAFFRAGRSVNLSPVSTVTTDADFTRHLAENLIEDNFVASFKQYLVNKKVYEAFDFMDGKHSVEESHNRRFFDQFESTLGEILGAPDLKLEFQRESFEFYIRLDRSRRITFAQLSAGFSAFLNIVMDLFMRTDLIRRQKRDFSLDVPGYVLIDEPETHFHLEMQYQILPLISRLFPRLQLVIATHSPAIISSLEDAVVFDLSTQSQVQDWVLGSSFSELMIQHFGLDNEFSPKADTILLAINSAVKENNPDRLKTILIENARFLTPSLRLEIESQIIELENRVKNND